MQPPGNHRQWQDQEQLGQETVEKVIAQIREKPFTEDLLRMYAAKPFQRHENDREQHQPDTQSEDIQRERREMLLQLSECFH